MIVLTQHGPASMFVIPDKWSYCYQVVYIVCTVTDYNCRGGPPPAAPPPNNTCVSKNGRPQRAALTVIPSKIGGIRVPAGQKLKSLRNRRNITVREVEQASHRIADVKGDKPFRISNGWLAQLEKGDSEPSMWKLFSLSVIYRANLFDL